MRTTHHAIVIAGPDARIRGLTFDTRGPILTVTDGGIDLSISAQSDLTAEEAERFADQLVTAAIEFGEATRREAARREQAAAESTYAGNIVAGSKHVTTSVAPTEDEVQR